MYDEAADVAEHVAQIVAMDAALAEAGAVPDWPSTTLVDVGGGGGLRAAMLSSRARRAYCADIIDQQARYDGAFVRLLAEKLERHGHRLAIDRFEFNMTDAMQLVYRDASFDFVCSFNAFEHIPDPVLALSEVARVLRPGGIAYVTFDPIWTADTGSHFQGRVPQPWAHLVLSEDDFAARMQAAGADAGEVREFRTAMNHVRLPVYKSLFEASLPELGLERLVYRWWSGVTSEAHLTHPHFAEAARRYSQEELLTRGMAAVLRKTAPAPGPLSRPS